MDASQSVTASFQMVENSIQKLFSRKRWAANRVLSLRYLVSTQGFEGWRRFWDDMSRNFHLSISGFLEDPDGPPVRPLLNAYLITIGKSDLSPYLARYDYSDCRVDNTLAEEALIGAQQIVLEIDEL